MFEWETEGWHWDDKKKEWKRSYAREEPKAPQNEDHHWRRRVPVILIVVAVLAAAGGIALRWRANRNLAAMKTEVQRIVDQEMWALGTTDWELYRSLLSPGAPWTWYQQEQSRFEEHAQSRPPSATITRLEVLEPGLALAEVRIDPYTLPPYRKTQAYRQTENGWRRAPAPAGHPWLQPAVHQTDSLRFIYHRDDADRLQPLFPQLQDLYSQLLIDFNLSPIPDKRELQIVVSVEPADPIPVPRSRRYDLSDMAYASNRERIKRELGTQLTVRVMGQFYDDADDMAFVLDAIGNWEVSSWIGQTDGRSDLAPDLGKVPFVPLLMVRPVHSEAVPVEALTETVVDFLVDRQGRSILEPLIDAAAQGDSWPSLIEEGLRLPYEAVAEAWWRFVATRYQEPPEESADQMRTHLTWMLQLEKQAIEHQDEELVRSMLDPDAPSAWRTGRMERFRSLLGGEIGEGMTSSSDDAPRIQRWAYEIQDWGHGDNVVWATLEHTSYFPDGRLTLSDQLRTYRIIGSRSYLTSPDGTLPPATLSTEHFEIHYREPDRTLLKTLAPSLDTLYEQIARDLGLDARGTERLVVEIAYSFDLPPSTADRPKRLLIHSPLLVGSLDAFQLNLAVAIVRRLLIDRAGEAVNRRVSDPLLNGLIAWEAFQLPENAHWEVRKIQMIRETLERGVLPPLFGSPSTFDPRGIEVRYYANATIAEYIAKTYGRNSFAAVVEAFQEYDDLHDVIPAVFGVDLEDFEAGWHSYLESQYRISDE